MCLYALNVTDESYETIKLMESPKADCVFINVINVLL